MHALRHFHASVLLEADENIKALAAEYLGHSDPGLTLRVHAHLMPSSQERTRKAVAAVFATARPEPSRTWRPTHGPAPPRSPLPTDNPKVGGLRSFAYFFLPWFLTASIAAAAASGSR
jgi:hypothetical protein